MKHRNHSAADAAIKRWIAAQSAVVFGAGLVFPFYLIFIKEVGANFAQFGLAYGLFAVASSLAHIKIGALTDKYGRKPVLLAGTWGTSLLFLLFPIVTGMEQIYVLQVLMGIMGAMQKTGEKAMVADLTGGAGRGRRIGSYHAWTGVWAGLAVMAGGFLIDLFTLDIIFYTGSVILFISGFWIMKLPAADPSGQGK